jgi:hypothetical protein
VPSGVVAGFVIENGTIRLWPGCNSASGKVSATENRLTVTGLMSTLMACPGARGDVEQKVLAVLTTGALDYRIEANTLTLTAPDGRGLMFTARSADSATPSGTPPPGTTADSTGTGGRGSAASTGSSGADGGMQPGSSGLVVPAPTDPLNSIPETPGADSGF